MKQKFLLFTFLLSFTTVFAQRAGDVTFYSNTGKKFFVVLNGIRQNVAAETNVNVSGLTGNWYSCRIMAEDKSFNIEKNIAVKSDTVVTYRVTEKKGKYKMRFYSEVSLGTAPAPQDQVTVVYHSTEQPNETVNTNSNVSGNTNTTNGSTTTMTTTTTTSSTSQDGTYVDEEGVIRTTNQNNGNGGISMEMNVNENGAMTTSSQSGSEGVSININVTENGMAANVDVKGGTPGSGSGNGNGGGNRNGNGGGDNSRVNGNVQSSSSYEETTTTTTSSSSSVNGTTTHSEQTTITTNSSGNGGTHFEETTITTTGSEGNVYTDDDMTMTMSSGGCLTSEEDFKGIKKSMENEAFSEDKMRIAKQAAKNKCMTVSQIKEIALLFDFSEDRMTFIQAAHLNCMNQTDYIQLIDVFDFSDDKETLEKFINSK